MEWIGVEIHPDTPADGRPLDELFPQARIEQTMGHLRAMGAPYGIIFGDRERLSNSRLALQAAEFSKDAGKFPAFHDALLQAYFSAGLDIGDREVLDQLAQDSGLDTDALGKALDAGTYMPRLRSMQDDAANAGVTGVPHFIIGGKKTIVGAQPIEVFRAALRSIAASPADCARRPKGGRT